VIGYQLVVKHIIRGGKLMKICITSQGDNLESLIDPRFGRCQYFIIVEPDTLEFEVIQNSGIGVGGGAGIQSGQLIVNKGVEVVLTGNVGPNAFATLQAAGIKIIVGVMGTVKEAIEKYRRGELKITQGPSVSLKFGLR
jgi:predicted Fe-Mo cluster-binding NifX family protein